jgi:hypothetical protein
VWAERVLYVVAGMIILVNLDNADLVMRAGGTELARPLAITSFAVALVLLGASGGLLRGTRLASLVITVVMTISIIVAAYVLSGGERILGGILIAAFAVAALILLWLPRSAAYFRRRDPAPLTDGRP